MSSNKAIAASARAVFVTVGLMIAGCTPVPFEGCRQGIQMHELVTGAVIDGMPTTATTTIVRCVPPTGDGSS